MFAGLRSSTTLTNVLRRAVVCPLSHNMTATPISSFAAAPLKMDSIRTFAMKINSLKPLPGSKTRKVQLGRGRSSGLGKTSGRGQKGQNARSGRRSRIRYEGGQTMLWRRSPKRGFKRGMFRQPLSPLNVGKLISFICQGRIDASKTITLKDIRDSNIIGKFKYGVKLLGDGHELVARLPVPINIEISHASAQAKDAIDAAGGSCKFVHFSRLGLRHHLKPGCLGHFVPEPSVPKPKKALRYEHQLYGKDGLVKASELRLARIVRKVRRRS